MPHPSPEYVRLFKDPEQRAYVERAVAMSSADCFLCDGQAEARSLRGIQEWIPDDKGGSRMGELVAVFVCEFCYPGRRNALKRYEAIHKEINRRRRVRGPNIWKPP